VHRTPRHGNLPRLAAHDQRDERHRIQLDDIGRSSAGVTRTLDDLNRPERGNPDLNGTTWSDTRKLLQTPSNRERHRGTVRLALGDRPNGGQSFGVGDSG